MLTELKDWKDRSHLPLILKGQRQVGKTYILEHFGRTEYRNHVLLDLANEPMSRTIFEDCSDVDSVIDAVSTYKGCDILPNDTLIILDEIQESPRARSFLKRFADDGRYDVAASGSLLGVSDARLGMYKRGPNPDLLPVGSEEHITMHSLDFEEFLMATGMRKKDIGRIRSDILSGSVLRDTDLEIFSERFRAFMVVGGMPAAVSAFVEEGMQGVRRVHEGILSTCINDINRYNTGIDSVKTHQCFQSIPYQLSESNKRFTYSRIDGGGSRSSAEKYMENLLWIKEAGYGNFSTALRALRHPLEKFSCPDIFKVYMSDTGLMMSMMGPDSRAAILTGDTAYDMGAVTENIVAECLMKSGRPIHYYRRTNSNDKIELDMVIEYGGITAIEVKTGAGRDYPSLKKTLSDRNVTRRVIFEKGNVRRDENGIEHYPHFAAAFLFPGTDGCGEDGLLKGAVGDPFPERSQMPAIGMHRPGTADRWSKGVRWYSRIEDILRDIGPEEGHQRSGSQGGNVESTKNANIMQILPVHFADNKLFYPCNRYILHGQGSLRRAH